MGCGASKPSPPVDVKPANSPRAASKRSEAKAEGGGGKGTIDATGKGPEHAIALFSPMYVSTKELVLAECDLTFIPPEVGIMQSLVKLDMSSNNLTELPAAISSLTNLITLDINHNSLKTLPAEIGELCSLSRLLLYKNCLGSLPDTIGNLTELSELNVFNNKVLKLPPAIGKLRKLEELNISANKVMKIEGAAVTEWQRVKVLNAFDCRVVMMPSLGHLSDLEELRMFGNNLNAMPSFGAGLGNLRILELHRNNITEIPAGFFKGMTSLSKLAISNNALTALPPDISESKIETLLCENNKLSELPSELATLPTLRVLLASDNQICTLAQKWKSNKAIARVNLSGNPVNGCEDVLQHLKMVCSDNNGMYWSPH